MNYSKLNFEANVYPTFDAINYPIIRYQDPNLDLSVSQHITETQKILKKLPISPRGMKLKKYLFYLTTSLENPNMKN